MATRGTRADILRAAIRLLQSDGLEGVTMRRVAREVGVSAPAIYRHFDSREALLEAAKEHAAERLGTYLFKALSRPTAVDQLAETGMQYLTFAMDEEASFQLLFRLGAASAPRDVPRAARELSPGLRFLMDRVAAVLDAPVDRGTLLELAVEQWALVHGLATLYLGAGGAQMMGRTAYLDMCRRIVTRSAGMLRAV